MESNKFGKKVFLCVPIVNYGKHTLTILETLVYELSIVDYFVFVECNQDYKGNPKKLIFEENKEIFDTYKDKILYSVINLPAENSSVENLMYHYSKLSEATSTAQPEDIVILSEDNIVFNNQALMVWVRESNTLFTDTPEPIVFKLQNFRYFLNLKIQNSISDSKNLMCLKKDFDPLFHFTVNNIDNLRSNSNSEIIGWHFKDLDKYPIFGVDIQNRKGNMFAGQINNIGTVTLINNLDESKEFVISCSEILNDLRIEDSVSINGLSLNVYKIEQDYFTVNIPNSLISNSALSEIEINSKVNLEISERYERFDIKKLPSYASKFFDDPEIFLKIPVLKPNPPQIKDWAKYLADSYESNTFSNNGPCVKMLEERFKTYLNLDNIPVLMNNATIGLTVAIKAHDLKNCDILIPSFTFSATAHSVLNAECNPILVDIEEESFHLCLKNAEDKLTGNTKALIVVQSLGYVCDYKKYEEFAKKHGLILIFDSAAALGASYNDETKLGSAGDCEIFSLHITKTFGIGEGCLVTSKNSNFIDKCRKIINFGFTNNVSTLAGTNAKCSEFHAAIGLSVMDTIDNKINIKKQKHDYYQQKFSTSSIKTIKNVNSGYQVYPIILSNKEERDLVVEALNKKGISTRIYYIPVHTQPFFKDNLIFNDLLNTENIADRVLCIPFYETITNEEMDEVFDGIIEALS
jgi:dTDP-4-amino-4,6-dideoxygalactose transaminase